MSTGWTIRSFWFTVGFAGGYGPRLFVGIVSPFSWRGALADGPAFTKHWLTFYPLKLTVRHQSWTVRMRPLSPR